MSEEKQMTPIQNMIDYLKSLPEYESETANAVVRYSIKYAESLLPKEKQGIIDTYITGIDEGSSDRVKFPAGEQYFNSKYNQ